MRLSVRFRLPPQADNRGSSPTASQEASSQLAVQADLEVEVEPGTAAISAAAATAAAAAAAAAVATAHRRARRPGGAVPLHKGCARSVPGNGFGPADIKKS